ncbi:MAG: glycosyltransferase, partial [Candidatus Levybacteria bacterium]|nr:glycosyltransferase [Candidatus Levybacteria bacterium]
MSIQIKIGIECESIENDTWGVARMTNKLLEEIAKRPELKNEFEFCLYFKSKIPDYPYLENPIFNKKIIKLPVIPSSFSLYYYIYLPIYLWFKRVDVIFFPNYMLPLIFSGKSVVMLTDDIYYESRNPKLPFRYRLAYRIFAGWAARHASRIMAISGTSKKELVRLFKIKPERIAVNYLGVDTSNTQTVNNGSPYILYVGQAFPRRHLKETILAFEKITTDFPELKLIAIGPDKYEKPTIGSLVSQVNARLHREAV